MTEPTPSSFEVHDKAVLAKARAVLDASESPRAWADAVVDAVKRNDEWRGQRCLNLLAPEAPTSPTVRRLLASEIGTRAAEGHIGRINRWFAGTQHIDEVEALCVELLKTAFRCRYADHRLMGSMLGNLTVYHALTQPGDTVMTASQPFGGHSSNRHDGPAGTRGLTIVDVPYNPATLEVDLPAFTQLARQVRPKLVVMGMSMTLFPLPVRQMSDVIAEWGGQFIYDGAHQAGLIAGGQFQDPLSEGAVILTGSAGKTFSGPQSGMIMWNDPQLTEPLTEAIFPVLVATHQVNRVAALAVAAAEMIEYGQRYMAQIVKNSQALGRALDERGISMLGADRGYSQTHQVIANVKPFGGGLEVAHRLAEANIITNKNLIPGDGPEDWDRPSGLRIGTIEITRLGLREADMATIADFIARVLINGESTQTVGQDVIDFRLPLQTFYYNFDNGWPAWVNGE
ncbi:MAG TPA: aminotransferase class I/II-fold pyridoxal phosphate-dependent enzyme [Anaerolineae bacterium]|nr:aminotransferase class I/II-fold pyridoxal phosphate-dependent enzyme [Anaerolineales bacterium]HRV93820.1 aminotransferase class I/II-fold pyridoxal phosphate-dependent enzyme [Anaerolineae bacterium]